MFYLNIPEFTKPYDRPYYMITDMMYFKREVPAIQRRFPHRFPEPAIQNNIYIYEYDDYYEDMMVAMPMSVSEESYMMVKKSYAEYLIQKKEAQEARAKEAEQKKKDDEYLRKHPVFKIKGKPTIMNPWKKKC
jgi:hypothetical protein